MARFVILLHDHPFVHWDLMLEWGAALRTWRLHAWPEPRQDIAIEALADHRREYLEYEGPISGNRGSVKREDEGTYTHLPGESSTLVVELAGQRLRGRLILSGTSASWHPE